ncbi:MAG: histidine--tRNA ligase [Alphaproteobacteria bacterium]|tara:strand:+ start:1539 stop:2768 length:1230 start_codon:yes stop_codon:yes gene_type:complete
MKDLFGEELFKHQYLSQIFRKLCIFYNYEEIATPLVEHIQIFNRSLGETSDIVSKEMYNFTDQGDDHLVLRPEGTAALARAYISNNFQQKLINKYFYIGSMFRRERPQSGRLRQFNQFGLEFFGVRNIMSDLEVILVADKFLSEVGIRDNIRLELNSLGNKESREKYVKSLTEFFIKKKNHLSEESLRRLDKNPLRILDSKNSEDLQIIKECPKINSFFDKESRDFFDGITTGLNQLGIKFELNPSLVRGLDYYNHTAFEYKTFEEKSQNTILAGGRYDSLVKMLGGDESTGVGWAAGIERIALNLVSKSKEKLKISIFSNSPHFDFDVMNIIKNLKPIENLQINFMNSGNFKKKLSRANKLDSFACIILAEDEWKQKQLIWKDLINNSQETFHLEKIEEFLNYKLYKK